MKRKVTINFTVSLDSSDVEESQLADYLINGIAVDEDGIDLKNGKSLVIYALKYLALKKKKEVKRKPKPVPDRPIAPEPLLGEEPKSGLGMFFKGKS